MSIKLRELIRLVRQCKTGAEERAVITKECALTRSALKEKIDISVVHRNVAKLLYIHMLGYPTYFGQMACLQLIASPGFAEKRMGYLGLMLLLDEKQEVLMLVTNSLKRDMESDANPYVVGLALAALGNISSTDMARDLSPQVIKLMDNANPFIRKKACLCALRVVRKCPEMAEDFTSLSCKLLDDKNHAVMLTTIQLLTELIRIQPKIKEQCRQYVPALSGRLKRLVVSGYSPEHDISGVTDPFLQCAIIKLFRILGQGNKAASADMADVLAQLATTTDQSKNPGNAILYECVQTIMAIEADASLRVLAVNQLGRFLQTRDNNIRYVALNTLCKVVNTDTQAIQRHRNVIVDCLKDVDISIRRRALDLIYALVNPSNIRALVRELLNYLALAWADVEFKMDLTEKICLIVERFAPSKRWHVDTIIRVLETAGNYTREYVAYDLLVLISKQKHLQPYAVFKLFASLGAFPTQQALVRVAVWCIGEYGQHLVSAQGASDAHIDDECGFANKPHSEDEILTLLHSVLVAPDATDTRKQYILNALVKLGVRVPPAIEKIKTELGICATAMSADLQQRAVEYLQLLQQPYEKLRETLLAQMPVLPAKARKIMFGFNKEGGDEKKEGEGEGEEEEEEDDDEEEEEEEEKTGEAPAAATTAAPAAPAPAAAPDLLGMGAATTSSTSSTEPKQGLDVLDALFASKP